MRPGPRERSVQHGPRWSRNASRRARERGVAFLIAPMTLTETIVRGSTATIETLCTRRSCPTREKVGMSRPRAGGTEGRNYTACSGASGHADGLGHQIMGIDGIEAVLRPVPGRIDFAKR